MELRSTEPGSLCLVVPDDLRAWARTELASLRPANVVHVHPVSRWLVEMLGGNTAMAEVIDWLQNERGARVVLTSGPVQRERELAQEIVRLCKTKPLFYDGNLSLSQIAALSAESDGYFGVLPRDAHCRGGGCTGGGRCSADQFDHLGAVDAARAGLESPVSLQRNEARGCDWKQVRACLAAIHGSRGAGGVGADGEPRQNLSLR